MSSGVRDKYHLAINGHGYMLRGAPNNPAYRRDEVPTAISRLALSDIEYSDFSGSGLFFAAQTDWSGGIKSQKLWADDAKYYYSTNIDAFSEPGAIKLFKQLEIEEDIAESITCGCVAEVAGSTNQYIGTDDGSDNRPKIYKNSSGTWADIVSTAFDTDLTAVSQLSGHKGLLVASSIGANADGSNAVSTYNGTSWTDHKTAIDPQITGGTFSSSRCHCELAGVLYVAVDSVQNHKVSIVSTVDRGATWAQEVYHSTNSIIIDMIEYGGLLYYILRGAISELRAFDPATNVSTIVTTLYNTEFGNYGVGGRYLHILSGKLIITVPYYEIYSFDGDNLTRIFKIDDTKIAIGSEAIPSLGRGGLIVNNQIRWGNLIFDGASFFNAQKDIADGSSGSYFTPLLIDSSQNIYGVDNSNSTILYKEASTYKPTLAKNFLVMSELSQVTSIDKLLYSITVLFDALAANQNIALEYSINGMTTWTALTTMTTTTEGTNTKREFIIPNSVLYNKLFVRIKLAGSATTPIVRDAVVAYRPIPNYKSRWQLRLEMSDGVKLLNQQNEQDTGSDLLSKLWVEKNTKQIVNFEDVDYVEATMRTSMTSGQTSALVDSTKGFPRKGRIRAVSDGVAEEMVYTSAETNKIKGITRAQRGTRAKAYLSGQVLKNDYSVYLEKIASDINFTDEKKTENIATVTLLEA